MSTAADAPEADTDAIQSADDWRNLSVDEQRAVLDEGAAERDETDVRDWDAIDDATQEDTLAAIEQSMGETWVARAFADTDDTTIPVEIYQLTESQQDAVLDNAQLFAEVEQAGAASGATTADELEAELGTDATAMFDSLDEVETWLNEFLGDVTVGEKFTAEWWRTGDYPAGLRMALFVAMVNRYQSQLEGAQSFRPESRGSGAR